MIFKGTAYMLMLDKMRQYYVGKTKRFDYRINISCRKGGPYVYHKRGNEDVGMDCKLVVLRKILPWM